MLEKCRNCLRTIGALEEAHLFNGHVVCVNCYATLTQRTVPTPGGQATPQSLPTPPRLDYQSPVRETRKPKPFVDTLFFPRFVFLSLFILSAVMNVSTKSNDHTYTIIFFCCWLLLGLVKIVLKGQHENR